MSNVQHWLRRCALTALMAVLCVSVVHAQAADPAPAAMGTTTTDTTTTTTMTETMTPDNGLVMANGVPDYRILNNLTYDYPDLRMAQRLGYTDNEIAVIAKIARLTDMPFRQVRPRVCAGRTFALLASDYGLRLGDVLDASGDRALVDEYLRLYDVESQLGSVHTADIHTAQTISGPTLAELEATYNQLNAAFPALPPTNIETGTFGTPVTQPDTTVAQAPPPPAPAPPAPVETPPAPVPPAPAMETTTTTVTHYRVRHRGHHRRRRIVHHRRHRRPTYMRHMGS